MNCSRAEATKLAEAALILVPRHARHLGGAGRRGAELGPGTGDRRGDPPGRPGAGPALLAAVEAVVLPQAAELAVGRLRALVRAELIKRDAEAADRRRKQAAAAADVRLRRSEHDGMAEVVTVVPQPVAAAMYEHRGRPRPAGQGRRRRAPDRPDPGRGDGAPTLRPWDDSRPPVTAELHVLAPINSLLADPADPGAGGDPAGHRRGGGRADHRGAPAGAARPRSTRSVPGGLQAPTGGSLHLDLLGAGGDLLATLSRRELELAVRRGCPAHPDGDCGCAVVGPPPPTENYRPTAAQRRWVKARDRHCRHPGCRNKVGWTDLDHVIPHADGGATDCDNLCCLCRRHHRLKTHAPGWIFRLDADGALLSPRPAGSPAISRPPGLAWLEPYELGALPPGVEDPRPRAVLTPMTAPHRACVVLPMSFQTPGQGLPISRRTSRT